MTTKVSTAPLRSRPHDDGWLQQNLDLAREGNEAAIDILWKQYGIDYGKEGGRYE